MIKREPIGFDQVLVEWGFHECMGRLHDQLSGRVPDRSSALKILLQTRWPLVAHLLAAEPIDTWRIDLEASDVPSIHTLEHPLATHSLAMCSQST